MNIEKIVKEFLDFVFSVRKSLNGITRKLTKEEVFGLDKGVAFNSVEKATMEETLKAMWDAKASEWVPIESDTAYRATMNVILQSFATINFPKNRRVRILSLGSGPGLYEMFIIFYLRTVLLVDAVIYCVDSSEGMVDTQKKIMGHNLRIGSRKLSGLREWIIPRVQNMTDLSPFYEKFDIVLCNNSLQWVTGWRTVISEVPKVFKADGIGCSMFFVHPSDMGVHVLEQNSEKHIFIPVVSAPVNEIEKELAKTGLVETRSFNIIGSPGSGQAGRSLYRIYLEFRTKAGSRGMPKSVIRQFSFL